VPKNPVDVHVGNRLKLRRALVGMSQDKLGQIVGLTFQQIQKYEKGANRIGASRLYQFATILDVPPAYFFDGLEGQTVVARNGAELQAAVPENIPAPAFGREDVDLLRAFHLLQSSPLRRRVIELVRAMADATMAEARNDEENSALDTVQSA
jgi:transcriptional regulator with XRE-family HTH domain